LKYKITFEIIWWVITAVIVALIILPIYLNIGDAYPFYRDNILIIIIAVTFIRYIFLLQHHWLTFSNYIKAVFIFIPIPILFFLLGAQFDFQELVDNAGIHSIMNDLSIKKQNSLGLYIKTEVSFFWAAALISNAFLPFRMIISIWRKINKGTE